MEIFRNRRHIFDEAQLAEVTEDDTMGEVVDSSKSEDGNRINYSLRIQDGSIREFGVPTRLLNVRFTSRGVEYLDEDH